MPATLSVPSVCTIRQGFFRFVVLWLVSLNAAVRCNFGLPQVNRKNLLEDSFAQVSAMNAGELRRWLRVRGLSNALSTSLLLAFCCHNEITVVLSSAHLCLCEDSCKACRREQARRVQRSCFVAFGCWWEPLGVRASCIQEEGREGGTRDQTYRKASNTLPCARGFYVERCVSAWLNSTVCLGTEEQRSELSRRRGCGEHPPSADIWRALSRSKPLWSRRAPWRGGW